jgi:DNA-binding NarL/FixJ family response regulator/type II secretory pathway pseudopilin PulG
VIRVGVVEDHPLYREALMAALPSTRFSYAFAVTTLDEAVAAMRSTPVEVVLVDVRLPDGDGLTLPGLVVDQQVAMPIFIAVTSFDDVGASERARTAGFTGFISKSTARLELLDIIDRCLGGDRIFQPRVAAEQLGSGLSSRELQVLALVAEGLSNRDVGEALGISRETAKSHVAQLLRKLDAVDRVHAVAKAYRSGLLSGPPPNGGWKVSRNWLALLHGDRTKDAIWGCYGRAREIIMTAQPPYGRNTAGLTILELLIAIVIFAVAILALGAALLSDFSGIRREGQVTVVNQVAVTTLERLRTRIGGDVAERIFDVGVARSEDVIVEGVTYVASYSVQPRWISIDGVLITAGTGPPHLFEVTVAVDANNVTRTYSTLVVRNRWVVSEVAIELTVSHWSNCWLR